MEGAGEQRGSWPPILNKHASQLGGPKGQADIYWEEGWGMRMRSMERGEAWEWEWGYNIVIV